MSDHDQTGSMGQDPTAGDDATMGSPKGGGTTPADSTGPGRYGGADDTNVPERSIAAGSEHDPMGGPGATEGRDLGSQDALTTHGGSSAALSGDSPDSTQSGSSEGSGEVH